MLSGITSRLSALASDPLGTIITLLYSAAAILASLILHECAHGYAALKCGDPTAKWMGRLTLDPRKHLDLIGTICMLFLHVGWAKPVPINPGNFKNYRRDYILVSLAGIITNLVLCSASLLLAALLSKVMWKPYVIESLGSSGEKSALLDLYHYLIPSCIYGGQFSMIEDYAQIPALMYVQRLLLMLAQMNLGLAIFNLIPVPPLDGYRFLDEFAFHGQLRMNPQTMQIIQIVFLVLCVSGSLSGFLGTVNGAAFSALSKLFAILI